MSGKPLLSVRNLTVAFGRSAVVEDLSFDLAPGEILGVVGESGSGKSITALSVLRLVPAPGRVTGTITLDGVDLMTLPENEMREIRGRDVAMIFQEPMTSLNPVFTCGDQVMEALVYHRGLDRAGARAEALRLLKLVEIPSAERRLDDYPHQLSGGMRQRVMIAMALACRPRVLLADEPTTALDATIQAQILDLLRALQAELGMAVVLITHDLGVVAEVAHRVMVMYAGRVVETSPAAEIFARPFHPYTEGLLASIPRLEGPIERLDAIPGQVPPPEAMPQGCRFAPRCRYAVDACRAASPPLAPRGSDRAAACIRVQLLFLLRKHEGSGMSALLEVAGLVKHFPAGRSGLLERTTSVVRAVDGVDLRVDAGETLALVGESGCGKSTTGRLVLRLIEPDAGTIAYAGRDLRAETPERMRALRRELQIIFQDPFGSLDPRMTVGRIIAEPMVVHGWGDRAARTKRVGELLARVGLAPAHAARHPHEFSGGQRQRIGIARALALDPKLIVCDEPVSALDVSIQAQVLNLMLDLQRERGLGYIFISHNLAVVRYMANRIAVMYLGKIVEEAPRDALFAKPLHPYTQALLSAVPEPGSARAKQRIVLTGDVPSAIDPPSGCRFRTRCPHAMDVCARIEPPLADIGDGRRVACHLVTPPA